MREKFATLWQRYFGVTDFPIVFYYSDEPEGDLAKPAARNQCMIHKVAAVARNGGAISFDENTVGCMGAKRYFGFADSVMPNFNYFLSCGIEGELEGERYKKSPEIVDKLMSQVPPDKASAKYIIFKHWQLLEENDNPIAVIFFAPPDVLSGLFTLAGFDSANPNAVIAPFGAGCATIVQYPLAEQQSETPRSVLGMFDVSARPFVRENHLSFSVPWKKFTTMVDDINESFLITSEWSKVQRRINR